MPLPLFQFPGQYDVVDDQSCNPYGKIQYWTSEVGQAGENVNCDAFFSRPQITTEKYKSYRFLEQEKAERNSKGSVKPSSCHKSLVMQWFQDKY